MDSGSKIIACLYVITKTVKILPDGYTFRPPIPPSPSRIRREVRNPLVFKHAVRHEFGSVQERVHRLAVGRSFWTPDVSRPADGRSSTEINCSAITVGRAVVTGVCDIDGGGVRSDGAEHCPEPNEDTDDTDADRSSAVALNFSIAPS